MDTVLYVQLTEKVIIYKLMGVEEIVKSSFIRDVLYVRYYTRY